MKWASAVSDLPSLDQAIDQCVSSIRHELDEGKPDIAIVFVSAHHASRYTEVPALLEGHLSPKVLIGCSAGGVIGNGHEVEHRPGVSLTAAYLPGVSLNPFHIDNDALPDLDSGPDKWEELVRVSAGDNPHFLLLADPFSTRADDLLMGLDFAFGGSVKIGGLASGAQGPGGNVLYLEGRAYWSGAVGISMHGNIVVDTVVAQGCRPIGTPLQVTNCRENLLLALDDEPPLELLQSMIAGLNGRDQELARHSLFLGVVMDPMKEDAQQGDFLIRNIVGLDPRSGALAIGERLQEGQTVQFHLRDAQTSTEDLDTLLSRYASQIEPAPGWGALLFSCLGRGEDLFGRPDHDTGLFRDIIGQLPLAGFFCNGEIGPVGGSTYLHGYTGSFGIFRPLHDGEPRD